MTIEDNKEDGNYLAEALKSAADKAFPTTDAAPVEETVAKSYTSSGQEAPEVLEQGVEDTPNTSSPAEYAKAVQLIGRASKKFGSEPVSIAGKSEAEVIALATEFDTLMRNEDREFSQAPQGESASLTGDEGTPDSGTVGTDTPAELEALLTSLKEDGRDEEADQLEAIITAQSAKLDAVVARLDGEAQARQLAPIEEAANEVFAGVEKQLSDLSKSQREDLMELAALIGNKNPGKYEKMSPAERVQSTLSQAIEVIHGVKPAASKAPARPAKRRTAEPAARGNSSSAVTDKPQTMKECLEQAADRAFANWR